MMNSDFVSRAIEATACDVTNTAFSILRPEVSYKVAHEAIYDSKRNIPLPLAVARSLTYYVMHNHYGFSYKYMSERSGMTRNAIVKAVRKTRNLIYIDSIYKTAYELFTDKLKDGIL